MDPIEVLAAYDQASIRSFPAQNEAEALNMLAKAHAAFSDRSQWLSAERRASILRRVAELIGERAEQLALEAAREGGKPLRDSRAEITRAISGVQIAIEEISRQTGSEIPMGQNRASAGRIAYTFREPRGVVLAISAFNHPFNLIIHQVIPAVASGCPVIVKPAKTTPISCFNLVGLLREAGLPDDWCQVLLCANQVTERLVSDSRVSFMSFIGSARVGWYLRSKLAPGATCALEHGGVAPVIIDESADIEAAVAPLVKGGFYHAGQVCVSVQRIFVHESVADAFTERFVEQVKALTVGDPSNAQTDVGPLILPREVDRVHEWVTEAVASGGKLLCGGERISKTCYQPTVVDQPAPDCRLSTHEVFGPVVALYRYSDVERAIEQANAVDSFFQAAVFTTKLNAGLTLSRRLNGLAVMVNDHTAFRVDWMPFGGHRQSGLGVGGIGYSMHDMTLERMVVFKL